MSSILQIDGTEYHPAADAAESLGYTREYLLMLTKAGKIEGKKISNKWYIHLPSAEQFFTQQKDVKEIRSLAVSEARIRELEVHAVRKERDKRLQHRRGRGMIALVETVAVFAIGAFLGTTGYFGMQTVSQQASLASASNFVDTLALSFYRLVIPAPGVVPTAHVAEVAPATLPVAVVDNAQPWTGELVHSPARAIEDSFSDNTRLVLDTENPSIAVVTPVFKNTEGATTRFLLTPIEIGSSSEDLLTP